MICFFLITTAQIARGADDMIEDGKTVKFHYTLTVKGEVADSSEGKEPFEYEHGNGSIIPGLSKELEGLAPGDKREVTVKPEEAYGLVDSEALIEVPKSRLPQGELQIGTVLTAPGEGGQKLTAVIKEIRTETVILDFNHPLAGKSLFFQVEIIEVL